MKKAGKILSFLFVLLMIASVFSVNTFAMTIYVEDFGFDINYDTSEATLVSYKGNSKEVVLPTKVYDYNITALGDSLFEGNKNIVSVNIPSSITEIGDSAFADCSSLKSITIPDSVKKFGEGVFLNCTALESVYFNADTTLIPQSTFMNCTSLEEITISESVSSLANFAFYNCKALKNISLKNISSMGQSAFYGTGIEKVSLSSKITSIDRYTFANCTKLEEIYLPLGVTEIDVTAFSDSESVVIVCEADSFAQKFAQSNSIKYKIVEATDPTDPAGDGKILGDVNGDGKVNIKDSTYIQKSAAKIFTLTDDEALRANVNGDAKVNVKDATAIQKYLAKIETGYPIGQPM